jgi:hypothetical protein
MLPSLFKSWNLDNKTLETYLLAADKEEFLQQFPQDSKLWRFFKVLSGIHQEGKDLSAELLEIINSTDVAKNQNHTVQWPGYFKKMMQVFALEDDSATDEQFTETLKDFQQTYLKNVKFDYAQPQNDFVHESQGPDQDAAQSEGENCLSDAQQSDLTFSNFVEKKIYQEKSEHKALKAIQTLPKKYQARLDLDKLIDKGTSLLQWLLENNLYLIPSVKDLPALLKKSKLQWNKEGISNKWSISEDFFHGMTQSQLESVMTAFPTECKADCVLKALFVKIFVEQKAQEGRTPLEEYELYCKIYEWLKKHQVNFNGAFLKFRVVVLHQGLNCGKYDRGMFKEFLGNFWERPHNGLFSKSCN